ncbi:MAG: transposase [Chloroflexi bacterium]|nr:transposase [Chloroflexota bacterium]MBI5712102.1 transposase [Chloroflexota bacterium]
MSPYSQDLRERVIAAIKAGKQTNAQIAETYDISEGTVENWKRRWRKTKSVAALPHAGGPVRVLQNCISFIRAEVKKQPDVTLNELCERVLKEKKVVANDSMMCRELQLLRLPRKKSQSMIVSGKHPV